MPATVTPALPRQTAELSAAPTTFPTGLTHFRGPYFGQKEPGSFPERFAAAMINGPLHTPPTFTPDGRQAYWSLQQNGIQVSILKDGFWTKPERAIFSESMTDFRDAFISPSGGRLFFLSKGKLPGSSLPEKENIWYVDRTDTGWGEPQPVSEEVNSHPLHWQVSVDNAGNLYFTSRISELEDIYVSRLVEGQYGKPERLSEPVNTQEFNETTPLIAPDSSYLIFARMDPATSGTVIRLYISYAEPGSDWSEAVLLDQVPYGLCPMISPDGKYLFFLSSPKSVSWMSTEFIEELRPEE